MYIDKISIKNLMSFKKETVISFRRDVNILIGPNGGGKSNLLDIIILTLRNFFIKEYYNNLSAENKPQKSIMRVSAKSVSNFIKNVEQKDEDSTIEIEIVVDQNDIDNLTSITDNRDALWNAAQNFESIYVSRDINFFDGFQKKSFKVGQKLIYKIINNELRHDLLDASHGIFLYYLQHHGLLSIIAKEASIPGFYPMLLYSSPDRPLNDINMVVNLSESDGLGTIQAYIEATSRSMTPSPFFNIAARHFIEKRRSLESESDNSGFIIKWQSDAEVQLVSKYLNIIGYDWDVKLINQIQNIYAINFYKKNSKLQITSPSSGEKEFIGFLFGAFGIGLSSGLLVIDEPELHLHPKWQNILLRVLTDFAHKFNSQVIFSTHSPSFIKHDTIQNVIRLFFNENLGTRCVNLDGIIDIDVKHLIHIINSDNNEKIFFADAVILVEGIHDRVIFSKIFDKLLEQNYTPQVIEIVEVHGKANFAKYRKFLNTLKIKNYIIADIDFLFDLKIQNISDLFAQNKGKIDSFLSGKKNNDRIYLIDILEEYLNTGNESKIKDFIAYLKNRSCRIKETLNASETAKLDKTLSDLTNNSVYILKYGEIENYIPRVYQYTSGVLELTQDDIFLPWFNDSNNIHVNNLKSISNSILKSIIL